MKLMQLTVFAALSLVLAAAGCGGSRYAKTSGVVTMDGEPFKNGVVSFQPIGDPGNANPGRGSSGYTDENGRFRLKTDDGNEGAVVGKHRVRIMTKWDNASGGFNPETGSPDGDVKNPAKVSKNLVPDEWNTTSTKEFVVPSGGTDQANFAIETKKKNPR